MGSVCSKKSKKRKQDLDEPSSSNPPQSSLKKSSKPSKSSKPKEKPSDIQRNFNEVDILIDENAEESCFPEFFTTSSTSGVWSYSLDDSLTEFSESQNQGIESDYLLGKPSSIVSIENLEYSLVFKESLMYQEDSVFPVFRTQLVASSYGFKADDKTARPLIQEIVDLLESTEGRLKCKIDGNPFSINIPAMSFVDLSTSVKRRIILM